MATNIIEAIQKNLEYPALRKVNPDTQETKEKYQQTNTEKLAQAAIPAILTAFYRLSRTEEGCKKLISADSSEDWLSVLYGEKEEEAVEKIAQYATVTKNQAEVHMEDIANKAASQIKESAGKEATPEKVKTYMNSQRHHILVYLPASLNMGDILNDEGLDDGTNKMEGPVSNFIHKIENNFSGGQ